MEKTLSHWNSKNFIPLQKGKKKAIINEIFISLTKHTTDKFWIEIFNSCSVGKFPKKGFIFQNNKLIYNHKKYDEVDIIEPSKITFIQVVDFFKKTISLISPNEEKEYFFFIPYKIESIKDIKNRNIRLSYIKKFMEEKYNGYKNRDEIIDKLLLYENFKLIDNSCYIFENNILKEIKGIECKNEKLIFNIKIKKKSKPTRKQKQNTYLDIYQKHFETFKRKNNKLVKNITTDISSLSALTSS